MKLRNFAVAIGVAALIIVGATPAGATSADNTNSPEYWETKISNDLGGAPVTCVKDEQGTVVSGGTAVSLDPYAGSDSGYVALIVKGGSAGEDGAGNNIYMFPNAGTAYSTPLNGGGQQSAVSHWIVCSGSLPVSYQVTCEAVTITYPQGIDSIDVNIRWTALPGGTTTTQNYHPNTGASDGQTVVVDINATGYYSVDWVQVNGTNYHWQEGLTCGSEPEVPEQPQDKVTYSDWTDGQWACEDTTVEQTRTKTTTPYIWDGEAWVLDTANAVTTTETGTRDLDANEIYSCPVFTPADPDLDGTVVTPMCDADGPYLAYTITVNDPDGTVDATSATLTFHHPTDPSQNWSIEVALGSGTAFWPGVTQDSDGTVVTWPGWYWDVNSQSWIEDPDANYGWTTEPGITVEVSVDPLVKMLTVTYAGDEPNCNGEPTIVVVDDVVAETPTLSDTGVAPTKAAAAVPVKAAASYAG